MFNGSNPRELFKDVPTVPAYFMAIHLFLQKKRHKNSHSKKKYYFQQRNFYIDFIITSLAKPIKKCSRRHLINYSDVFIEYLWFNCI